MGILNSRGAGKAGRIIQIENRITLSAERHSLMVVGKKPLDHKAEPARGPRGPDCSTTKPGKSSAWLPMPYVTQEPMEVRQGCGDPVCMNSLAGPWLNTSVAMPRKKHTSSTISRW